MKEVIESLEDGVFLKEVNGVVLGTDGKVVSQVAYMDKGNVVLTEFGKKHQKEQAPKAAKKTSASVKTVA